MIAGFARNLDGLEIAGPPPPRPTAPFILEEDPFASRKSAFQRRRSSKSVPRLPSSAATFGSGTAVRVM
jgi:hypothetical protein